MSYDTKHQGHLWTKKNSMAKLDIQLCQGHLCTSSQENIEEIGTQKLLGFILELEKY